MINILRKYCFVLRNTLYLQRENNQKSNYVHGNITNY